MPRSRRFRKNQDKPEWGKNNPQTKAKNRKMLMVVAALVIVVVVISAFVALSPGLFAGPAASPSPSPTATPTINPLATPTASPSPTPLVTASPVPSPLTSPAGEYSATGTRIQLVTSMGNITIQLRDDKPITSGNFKSIVERGLYDGTFFHRVIAGFMIQGGGLQQTVPTIADEIGTNNRNTRGTIAMAKTDQPNSATSQFFINVVDNGNNAVDNAGTKFDAVYTQFGTVIQGLDVVDAISKVPVTTNPVGENSQPVQDVYLFKAIVLP
jgi:cyclophilin family peptidyl-prolyl cis-trans isomerase